MNMKRILLKLFLVLFIPIILPAQNVLSPEALFKLKRVGEPVLSPKADKLVYSARSYDLAANSGNTDLFIYDFKTNTTKELASDKTSNESSPSWSSDGLRVYFLNDKGGSSQLWSINADGSGLVQQTTLEQDINLYGIAPGEGHIWLAMDVKIQAVTGKEIYSDLQKSTGKVYDDLMMRHWDSWEDGSYSHIFVASFSDGKISSKPIDLMPGEPYDAPMKPFGGAEQLAWSPDGKTLAYTCKRSTGLHYATHTNSDVYLYNVDTRQTNNISGGMLGYDKDPTFSPDGKFLAWLSMEKDGNEADRIRLFLYDREMKTKTELSTNFEDNVDATVWSSDSRKIYFLSSIQATSQVFVYDLGVTKGNPIKKLTNDIADFTGMTLAAASSKKDVMVCTRMTMSEPTDLFTVDLKSGVSKQITFNNKEVLSSIKMGEVKKRMVKSTDGKEILTWVIYPPDFDPLKKYPTLLYCQGGPESPVSQFFSYRWNFQMMAANGYIVVAPNRRGLPGFGKDWNDAIVGDWGGQPMRDLLSAIDDVSKEAYVDTSKLGAVGASYGGYSVFWLEGNHQKRFKAFISHCGVFNLESMLATEEIFFHDYEQKGMYWDSPVPKGYTDHSPHRYVKNWDTPILIIANERDYRVPYTQSLEAFSAARLMNVPARFLSYADENHWVLKPQNSVMWQREFFKWLDTYLK
jgi:dipeptidyl aminopeptidase/acylaminoacyl peptidase